MNKITPIFCFSVLIISVYSAKLPSSFQKCNRSSKDFNECLARAIQNALGQSEKSFREIGIPQMEPLDLPELTIGAGSGSVNLVQNYKNVKVGGYSKAQIKKVDLDFAKKTMKIDFYIDNMTLDADYDVKGKILLLPVYGKGPCTLSMERVSGHNIFTFEETEKSGKQFLKIATSDLIFDPEHCVYRFDNLFDGNKELGDNINNVMNDNWKEVFDDVKGGYQAAFAQIHFEIAKKVFSKVSLEDMFDK